MTEAKWIASIVYSRCGYIIKKTDKVDWASWRRRWALWTKTGKCLAYFQTVKEAKVHADRLIGQTNN